MEQIGQYRILRRLGGGGFGEVCVPVQRDFVYWLALLVGSSLIKQVL